MEEGFRTLWFSIIFVLIKQSLSTEVCGKEIDAAFQRLENPRFVFLVSGSNLWELDRVEDKFVQEMVPLQKYFPGAPESPDLTWISVSFTGMIAFMKNQKIHYIECGKHTEDCKFKRTVDLEKIFKDRKVTMHLEAGFSYLENMPRPNSHTEAPYVTHFFNKEGQELDCRSLLKIKKYGDLCDFQVMDQHLFPNYHKLNPKGERVYAVEAFHNRTTNVTDFLIVTKRSLRYTINNQVKIRKCGTLRRILLLLLALLVFLLLMASIILVTLGIMKHRSKATNDAYDTNTATVLTSQQTVKSKINSPKLSKVKLNVRHKYINK